MTTKQQKIDFSSLLISFSKEIESKIKNYLSHLENKNKLSEACEYALLNGGKRFRPALVLMVAKALNNKLDVSESALAIEFFHTASLVADDLPCMDNDDERRNKPSLHKVFGEAMTLLVSYALIAAGYECLAKNANLMKETNFKAQADAACVLALENATYNTGLSGATGGQFLDIFPPNLEISTLRDIIHKKTGSLFEIAFVFGWLFGGGDKEHLSLVKKVAAHFGMAFQIVDDIGDMQQDIENKKAVNLANALGLESALKMFHEEIGHYRNLLIKLKIDSGNLTSLADLLEAQIIPYNNLIKF